MSFIFINVEEKFQRAIDYAFRRLVEKSIIIYMNNLIILSKDRHDHAKDLRAIFKICKVFGISLNPNKFPFGTSKGKLLGNIISEHVTFIDPDIFSSIQKNCIQIMSRN